MAIIIPAAAALLLVALVLLIVILVRQTSMVKDEEAVSARLTSFLRKTWQASITSTGAAVALVPTDGSLVDNCGLAATIMGSATAGTFSVTTANAALDFTKAVVVATAGPAQVVSVTKTATTLTFVTRGTVDMAVANGRVDIFISFPIAA